MANKIDRRRFLVSSSLAAGGALVQACTSKTPPMWTPTVPVEPTMTPPAPDTPPPRSTHPDLVLTFLHTNDTHGHLAPFRILDFPAPVGGIARRASMVREIRRQAAHVLLVDAGDVHQGCLMADAFQGQPDIELMNELGYVAMGLGNHDLDYGRQVLQQRREAAFFPILCANVYHAEENVPLLEPYAIINEGGVRIAMTSFAGPDWPHIIPADLQTGLRFADPIETARALIPQLKAQADLVVVLGHQYLKDDYALAGGVPGIDIIIGAHEHAKLTEAVQVGGTLIVENYQWGAYLGRLDVAVSGGRITSYAYGLIPLTVDVPADPDLAARVGVLEAEMRRMYPERFEQIGEAAIDIADRDIRFREAPLGNLVCDVVRAQAGAEACVLPALTVLNSLFAGPLTVQDVCDALPYPNQILRVQLRGEQLQQLFDIAAAGSGTGNFVQVSGIRLRILGGVATQIAVDGQPLDRERVYTVATTDYHTYRAIDYRDLFSNALNIEPVGITVKDALIAYIRTHSPIAAYVDGRIITEGESRTQRGRATASKRQPAAAQVVLA